MVQHEEHGDVKGMISNIAETSPIDLLIDKNRMARVLIHLNDIERVRVEYNVDRVKMLEAVLVEYRKTVALMLKEFKQCPWFEDLAIPGEKRSNVGEQDRSRSFFDGEQDGEYDVGSSTKGI